MRGSFTHLLFEVLMKMRPLVRTALLLLCGALAGAFVMSRVNGHVGTAQAPAPVPAEDTLQADVAHLKDVIPGQSHSMIDVGYHMANLWYAVQRKNWPLAAFEVDETRNRIRWTIRISPTRKDPQGNVVDLKGIFDGMDASVLPPLKKAVEDKDVTAFVAAYRETLETCYACHKSSGKPYLRPMIPTVPPQAIINYDPNPSWPQ
jgi:hypothetical protein